ncbi:MAG: zinc ribbon domain-containing protein [Candidatus Kapabacteria bacterium]|nr:zinc ribbon domain-containing protein [Candidatus Kapabacteria bacterium]
MPTYEYQCTTCGATFDYFQKMSDDALTQCPAELCKQEQQGAGTVVRKIGAGAGLIFNGSGFYITDYKSGSSSGGSGSSGGTSSGESSAASSAPAPSASSTTTND